MGVGEEVEEVAEKEEEEENEEEKRYLSNFANSDCILSDTMLFIGLGHRARS